MITGRELFEQALALFPPSNALHSDPLLLNRFMRVLRGVMREVNEQVCIYSGRKKFYTEPGYRFYLCPNDWLSIEQASDQYGRRLRILSQFEYPGAPDSIYDTSSGKCPVAVGLVHNESRGENLLLVEPKPNDRYLIRLVVKLQIPPYLNPDAPLPVRETSVNALLYGILLKIGRIDFHDNVVVQLWEAEFLQALNRLRKSAGRPVFIKLPEPADFSEDNDYSGL